MKKALAVSIATASAVIALAAAPLTPEQTLDRRSIGDVEFSPDGSRLAFTVTDPPKGSSRARALWLMEVASGQVRQLTFSGKNDGSPRWSPDGTSTAFTSDRDGAPQLYRLSLRGGDAEKLTEWKDAVSAFRWSPDGMRIAVLMAEPKSDVQQQREKDKDDSRIVDKDDRHPRVWMLDVESKALTPVTTGRWQIRQIEWLPAASSALTSTPTSCCILREGHGFREEKHLLDRLNFIVAWYDRYLKPHQPATAQ
jgi:dipeptidyl aminopeptidase/acylaminoacyl peptidase